MSKLYAFFSVCHEKGKFDLDFLGSTRSKDIISAIRGFLGSQCNREQHKTWEIKEGTFFLDPKLMKKTKKLGFTESIMLGWFVKEISVKDIPKELYKIQEEVQSPSPLAFAF